MASKLNFRFTPRVLRATLCPPKSEPASAPTKTHTLSSVFADQLGADKRLYETLRALHATPRPRNKRASEHLFYSIKGTCKRPNSISNIVFGTGGSIRSE